MQKFLNGPLQLITYTGVLSQKTLLLTAFGDVPKAEDCSANLNQVVVCRNPLWLKGTPLKAFRPSNSGVGLFLLRGAPSGPSCLGGLGCNLLLLPCSGICSHTSLLRRAWVWGWIPALHCSFTSLLCVLAGARITVPC